MSLQRIHLDDDSPDLPNLPEPAGEPPASGGGAAPRISRAFVWWVDHVRRLAWLVLLGAVLVTVAGGWYTATHLGIHTDTGALLDQTLPYWQTQKAFEKAFPALQDNLVVLIEGDSPDRAEDAANLLAARLRARSDLFSNFFFPGGDAFFRRAGLLFLDSKELGELSDRLAQAQPLLGTLVNDPSLRGLFHVLGEAADGIGLGEVDPGLLARPLSMIGDAVEGRAEGKPARLSWRDLMTGLPDKPSDRRQIILVQPKLDYGSLQPASTAMDFVHDEAARLHLDPAHGVRVRLTGSPALDQDELSSVRKGVGLASVLSFILVSILVLLGLRSFKLVFATLASLVLSLIWTAAFATLAIGHLNLISVAFAVLFIGLAVDFSIQFGMRYKEAIDQGASLRDALAEAASGTGIAVGLAALCAAIGFFSFVPTEYVGLRELGVIAGVGMFIGFFATMTLLPALLTVMPIEPRPRRASQLRNGKAMGGLFSRHARTICLGALVLGIASLFALPYAQFDIDPINLKDPTTESVKAYFDLTTGSSTSPYSINIVEPNLPAADALGKRLERLPEVDNTVSLSSFVPDDQTAKLQLIDQMATFMTPVLGMSSPKPPPSDAERRQATAELETKLAALAASPKAGAAAAPAKRLADQLARFEAGPGHDLAAYGGLEDALIANFPGRLSSLKELMAAQPVTLDSLPQNLRARYLTPDGRARLEVFPTARRIDKEVLTRFVDAVKAIAPNATDTPVLLLEGGKIVVGAFAQAGIVAFFAIGILLVLILRSFRDWLLVLLPLALAGLLTVATVVLLGLSFNFANIIALPLLFSLGVAFGIYLILRLRETGSVVALLHTSTPRAVLFSALTTMVSFSSLMVSYHRGTASTGYLLGICLTLALVCTLVVLPALLMWREQRQRRAAGGEPTLLKR
jgi:hopanoid biosynthesis associated RND transporter like protein HpnN